MTLKSREWQTEQCPRCHQCKSNPTQKTRQFSALCPAIEHGQFHAYSGGGKIKTAYALMHGATTFTPEVVDSIATCSMCGACDTACQLFWGDIVEPLDTIYELRVKMFEEGALPASQRKLLDNIAETGNIYGRPAHDRTLWASGLELTDATEQQVDILLHVGCANAFDEAQWPGLVAVANLLKRNGTSFGTLGAAEEHAGSLPFELGHLTLARRCAEQTATLVKASGAKLVVTCDGESLAAFRNFHPRLGVELGPVRVIHVTEYIEELSREGRWRAETAREEVVTYHDPCRLGRLSEKYKPWEGEWTTVLNGLRVAKPPRPERFGLGGVYDAPRSLLAAVPGTRVVEMERKREFSYCCGAGGGGKDYSADFADTAALSRLNEARATGATTLVTSCGTCARHLEATATRHGIDIKVADIINYISKA